MPNAIAPNAPCVEVWLSPHAIVMPGCVRPSSGPMTWTMPCDAAVEVEQPDAELAAVALERRDHVLGHHVEERPRADRWSGRCDRRWRTCAPETRTFQPARAQHVERLRRGDLVDQVQADEQLRLAARQRAHRMRVPDLLEERGGHGGMVLRARRSGFGGRRSDRHGSGLDTDTDTDQLLPRPDWNHSEMASINPARSRFAWSEVSAERNFCKAHSWQESTAIGSSRYGTWDGARTGVLRLDRPDAEGRALRIDLTDPTGRGFDSGEYRRGAQPALAQGLSVSRERRPGIAGRTGNAPRARRAISGCTAPAALADVQPILGRVGMMLHALVRALESRER